MTDYSNIFGSRVNELRKAKGLKQSELAEKLGTKKPSISQWESGTSTPSFAMLCELADFFDVSLDYLVGRSDDPKAR